MSSRQLHFQLTEQATARSINREVKLQADGEKHSISILYEIFDTGIGALPVLDGLVQGVLFHCMQRGLPLRIHGPMSASAMANLHEFQRCWVMWKPETYRHIDLIPDAVVKLPPSPERVIQA